MQVRPARMPFTYGTDFFNPKLAPDESKKVLFGPGDTDVTKLKIAADANKLQVIG
jgi:hypothetical protein